jgi:hypothetical protein
MNLSNISMLNPMDKLDCTEACATCANAVRASLGNSKWLIAVAFIMIFAHKFVKKESEMVYNIGMIVLGVCLLYWFFGFF